MIRMTEKDKVSALLIVIVILGVIIVYMGMDIAFKSIGYAEEKDMDINALHIVQHIDRSDGDYYLRLKTEKSQIVPFHFTAAELPQGLSVGDIITKTKDGKIIIVNPKG